jgi:nucleotide-binding universal stress UspA family protein
VLDVVASIARVHGATVRLLRVVPTATAIPSDDGTRVIAFADQEAERCEHEARAYLREVAQRLPGVTVEDAVRVGEAVGAIVDEAEAAGADLIALASHHRSMLSPRAGRSVARRLRRVTTIPTLVVRYGDGAAA